MATSATFQVSFDGTPLPEDIAPLLTSAYVDSSLRLPDSFMLRFRDPNRIVVEKAKVKIGTKVKITISSTETETPEELIEAEVTSLEAEIGTPGSFTAIRGYDPAPLPRSPSGRSCRKARSTPVKRCSTISVNSARRIGNSSTGSPSASDTS